MQPAMKPSRNHGGRLAMRPVWLGVITVSISFLWRKKRRITCATSGKQVPKPTLLGATNAEYYTSS